MKSGGVHSIRPTPIFISVIAGLVTLTALQAQTGSFHRHSASAAGTENPYQEEENLKPGQKLMRQKTAPCVTAPAGPREQETLPRSPTAPRRQHNRVKTFLVHHARRDAESQLMPSWASPGGAPTLGRSSPM